MDICKRDLPGVDLPGVDLPGLECQGVYLSGGSSIEDVVVGCGSFFWREGIVSTKGRIVGVQVNILHSRGV